MEMIANSWRANSTDLIEYRRRWHVWIYIWTLVAVASSRYIPDTGQTNDY